MARKSILKVSGYLAIMVALAFTAASIVGNKALAQGSTTPLWTIPGAVCTTALASCSLIIQIDSANRLFVYNEVTYQLYVIAQKTSTFQHYDLSAHAGFLSHILHFQFIPFNDYIVLSIFAGGVYKYTLSTQKFEPLLTNPNDSFHTCDYNAFSEYYPPFGQIEVNGPIMVCGVVEGYQGRFIISFDTVTGQATPLFEPLGLNGGAPGVYAWRRLIAGLNGAVYRQGTFPIDPLINNGIATILRRYPQDSSWTNVNVAVDQILSADARLYGERIWHHLNLMAVDSSSNLYNHWCEPRLN